MVGILLVTHSSLGDSFVDCVGHVFGSAPRNLMVLSVRANDDAQRKEAEGRAVIKHLDTGEGVLVLVDVFGATPGNIAARLCQIPNVRGVAGLNLPMLLRVVTNTGKSLDELAQMALEGGRDCIIQIDTANMEQCDAAK
ncbi:MAG TPA: PTS sugar transporter subunit IIA [Gallionellaceae bacterium]